MFYVLQVKTGEETAISNVLRKGGIKALVPRENRIIRSGGGQSCKEYVLFPGYVFIDTAYSADNYYLIKKVPGVIRFLGDAKSPSRLTHIEAEWVSALTGADNAALPPTVVKLEGSGYKAVSGALVHFENRITKYDKRQRKATFEITILGEAKEAQLSILFEGDEPDAIDSAE